jgi:hypothetical protein
MIASGAGFVPFFLAVFAVSGSILPSVISFSRETSKDFSQVLIMLIQ